MIDQQHLCSWGRKEEKIRQCTVQVTGPDGGGESLWSIGGERRRGDKKMREEGRRLRWHDSF